MEVPQKTKNRTTIWSSNPTLKHISSKAKIQKDTYTSVFRAALFTTAKTWKRSRLPSTDEWIKMWCIYIKYTADYYLAVKKKDIMPLASPWTDLEIIGLLESERDQHHMGLTFMGNLKYDTNEPILQNRNRLTDRENTLVVAKRGGGWRRDGLGVSDSQMQTIMFRMDKQQSPAVQHRELYSISCNKP